MPTLNCIGVNCIFSQIIKGAGHHVYADKAGSFNLLMMKYLDDIDNKLDNLPNTDTEPEPSQSEVEVEQVPITQF